MEHSMMSLKKATGAESLATLDDTDQKPADERLSRIHPISNTTITYATTDILFNAHTK